MSSAATAAKLDANAVHVAYELSALVHQTLAFFRRQQEDEVSAALFEAALTHVRLLDEFFAGKNKRSSSPHRLLARDWLPDWKRRRVVSRDERREIRAHVGHLSASRDTAHEWPLHAIVDDCCRVFALFLSELERSSPDRVPAFAAAQRALGEWSAPSGVSHVRSTAWSTLTPPQTLKLKLPSR